MINNMNSDIQYKTFATNPENIKKIIVCLHGLGASADDFIPFAKMINNPDALFIFPQAPTQPISINAGMSMPAWYDIYGIGPDRPEDNIGIKKSAKQLANLINEIKSDYPKLPIKLMGFSQGGALALYTAITNPELCEDILGLSTYLPLAKELISNNQNNQNNQNPNKLNIQLMHGTNDTTIDIKYAQQSQEVLKQLGYYAPLTKYQMGHEICPEQVPAIINWV
jgi:phospholipase/carboxylesterase